MDATLEKPADETQAQQAYGAEVLCASWNPLVSALAQPVEACRDLVAEIAATDVESFLTSFYRSEQG